MRTALINKEDFKYRVELSSKTPDDKLLTHIYASQERNLLGDLCGGLYDELIDQVKNETLTDANKTLLDNYVKPYLVQLSYTRYLLNSGIHSTASGMVEIEGDNSRNTSKSNLSELIARSESDSYYYLEKMKTFLDDNISTYPLWKGCNCKKRGTSFKISSIQSNDQTINENLEKNLYGYNSKRYSE